MHSTTPPPPRAGQCCYIGLGSNLQSPLKQIRQAIAALADTDGIELMTCAPIYTSKAVGPGKQPDYLNTVVELRSTLSPEALLKQLQTIEQQQGRQRALRWGARTIDLDLLLYANQSIEWPTLQIPHPRMRERNFVIFPLYDIAPTLVFPDGQTIASVYATLTDEGIKRLYNVAPSSNANPLTPNAAPAS